MFRRLFVYAIVFALAVGEIPVQAAGVSAIGVVTQASGASLSKANVSAGATVFDGDSFSTAPTGLLRVRTGAAQLYLTGQSSLKLNSAPGGTLVQLASGTMVFSSAKAAAMDVEIAGAHIRAASDQPSIVQVSVVNSRMIEIRANRGAVLFSYKDDSEVVPEGRDAKILLDPTDAEVPAATAATPAFPDQQQPRRGRKRRLAFYIFWGSVAGITTGIIVHHALESPEKP